MLLLKPIWELFDSPFHSNSAGVIVLWNQRFALLISWHTIYVMQSQCIDRQTFPTTYENWRIFLLKITILYSMQKLIFIRLLHFWMKKAKLVRSMWSYNLHYTLFCWWRCSRQCLENIPFCVSSFCISCRIVHQSISEVQRSVSEYWKPLSGPIFEYLIAR
jgi:hypothetical protein